jgi:hypothetical protein
MASDTDRIVPMVQAALIGQTFGLLSGARPDLQTSPFPG